MKELYSKGLISENEAEAAETDFHVARAAYDTAVAEKNKFRAQDDRIRAQEAAVQEAEAALRLAELNHDYSFVRSPVSGVVASRPAKLGETLAKGGIVAEVVDVDSLYVSASIDEVDVASVKAGQTAKITLDAYPGDVFRSRVYLISPLVTGGEREARTFEVRLRVEDNKKPVLKPGMSADVEIVVQSLKGSAVVPAQAVFERDSRKFVYASEGGRARLREIKAGASSWEYVEVLEGLKEGDEIVITPDAPGLADDSRIQVEHASD
jgi:HlyD family secretion protein